jgi:hypothetical protein
MPSTALIFAKRWRPRITPLVALRRRPGCEARIFMRESYHSPDILPSVGTINITAGALGEVWRSDDEQ